MECESICARLALAERAGPNVIHPRLIEPCVPRRAGDFRLAPEGHRSETGGLGEAHEGIAFVAYRAKVPIVPVGISGTPAFKHNYWKMKKSHVTYRFGQPFTLDAGGARVTTEILKQMTDEAMYQLAALLPPEQRGLYEDLDQATAKYVKFTK